MVILLLDLHLAVERPGLEWSSLHRHSDLHLQHDHLEEPDPGGRHPQICVLAALPGRHEGPLTCLQGKFTSLQCLKCCHSYFCVASRAEQVTNTSYDILSYPRNNRMTYLIDISGHESNGGVWTGIHGGQHSSHLPGQ